MTENRHAVYVGWHFVPFENRHAVYVGWHFVPFENRHAVYVGWHFVPFENRHAVYVGWIKKEWDKKKSSEPMYLQGFVVIAVGAG